MLKDLFLSNKSFQKALKLIGQKVTISVGFGVPRDLYVSLRLGAYLLPAIYLAKALAFRGNHVRIRAYIAEQSAPIVLGATVDMERVKAWSQMAQSFLRDILKLSEVPNFLVTNDVPWSCGGLPWAIDKLSSVLWPERILRKIERYPDPGKSIRYLAAHSLYMLDPLDIPFNPILLSETVPPFDEVVLVVGGPQENFTSEVRSHLRETIGVHNKWQTWDLRCPIGKLPVYNETGGLDAGFEGLVVSPGERTFRSIQEIWDRRKEWDPDAFSDLQYLAAHCSYLMGGSGIESRKNKEVFIEGLVALKGLVESNYLG